MHVVRQNNPSIDVEWVGFFYLPNGGAGGFDLGDQKVRSPVAEIYREEIGSSGNTVATVNRHVGLGNMFGLILQRFWWAEPTLR